MQSARLKNIIILILALLNLFLLGSLFSRQTARLDSRRQTVTLYHIFGGNANHSCAVSIISSKIA